MKDLKSEAEIINQSRDNFKHLLDPIFKKESSLPVDLLVERLLMHHRNTTPLSTDKVQSLREIFKIACGEQVNQNEFCVISSLGDHISKFSSLVTSSSSFGKIDFPQVQQLRRPNCFKGPSTYQGLQSAFPIKCK